MTTDISLSQLLCSRLCHDLVGAAGAINAGIELLNEDPSDIAAPLGLMETSAAQVTRRLSFFRVAFGSAGGPDSPVDADNLRGLIEGYLEDKKLDLDWRLLDFDGAQPSQVSASGKLLCLLMIVAGDCLPRGGILSVHVAPLEGGIGIAVEGRGTGARIPENVQIALKAEQINAQINARNVHAFFASRLAAEANGSIEIEADDDSVQIASVLARI